MCSDGVTGGADSLNLQHNTDECHYNENLASLFQTRHNLVNMEDMKLALFVQEHSMVCSPKRVKADP
jgi:hypothetical protein